LLRIFLFAEFALIWKYPSAAGGDHP